ncbi:MAG: heavy metal translocating P-type ATPase [Deltaproteobacteria bacterium]|nr:MAG: heavy metal translocating P-type ATPase [Deltaproteobacteria bacterium]
MKTSFATCDLCGLPLRYQKISSTTHNRTFHFCCMGCKQVFHMLIESSDAAEPESFRDTELFKKCREIGIIPKSEADLEEKSRSQKSPTLVPSPYTRILERDGSIDGPDETHLSLTLTVNQMWCPACAWVIEETLRRTLGIIDASCNFATDRVRCDFDPVLTSPQRIIDAIKSFGYEARLPHDAMESRERRAEFIRFVISAFLTMNVMTFSFALYSGFFTEFSPETIWKLSWPIFVMASIVVFYGGRNIYRRAWAGISTAAFSMETLITVGSFSAYVYSIYGLLIRSIHLYFDTASMLITLVLLGKLLERRAKDEVQQDLADFFSLRPTKVKICSDQHPEGRYVSTDQLRTGDLFKVEVSEVLAADGLVVAGDGTVDESSLTGEPHPIGKKFGDRVKSGTRLIHGLLTVRAEEVGEDSIVGQMIAIMERTLGRRTVLEGRTERALQWFVPIILTLAAGTGVICLLSGLTVDEAMTRVVTVTVISCPCTLGIAIPMARVAGISLAGKKGILVRDFSSFEQAHKVNSFVFDKTGTVTKGDWTLVDLIPVGSFSTQEILGIAASLEREVDHLIGAEITRAARKNETPPVGLEQVVVHENGVSGVLDGQQIKIGSKEFLARELENSPALPPPGNRAARSLVFMSYADHVCAVFVFGDQLKPTSTGTVQRLHAQGYSTALVSGDEDQTTKAIGNQVGIHEARGGKLPQDKAIFIAGLQQQGRNVAMVGDGVNDAPAMVQADLAIAVHSGNHLGKEAADITLMRGDLLQICDFVELAKKVRKKIHQNLGFSFIYNVVSIPIAMGGLLTPLVAVSAMLLSSLSVIGNTLLLLKRA